MSSLTSRRLNDPVNSFDHTVKSWARKYYSAVFRLTYVASPIRWRYRLRTADFLCTCAMTRTELWLQQIYICILVNYGNIWKLKYIFLWEYMYRFHNFDASNLSCIRYNCNLTQSYIMIIAQSKIRFLKDQNPINAIFHVSVNLRYWILLGIQIPIVERISEISNLINLQRVQRVHFHEYLCVCNEVKKLTK